MVRRPVAMRLRPRRPAEVGVVVDVEPRRLPGMLRLAVVLAQPDVALAQPDVALAQQAGVVRAAIRCG